MACFCQHDPILNRALWGGLLELHFAGHIGILVKMCRTQCGPGQRECFHLLASGLVRSGIKGPSDSSHSGSWNTTANSERHYREDPKKETMLSGKMHIGGKIFHVESLRVIGELTEIAEALKTSSGKL